MLIFYFCNFIKDVLLDLSQLCFIFAVFLVQNNSSCAAKSDGASLMCCIRT